MRLWSGPRQVHRVVGEEPFTGLPNSPHKSEDVELTDRTDTVVARAHEARGRGLMGAALLALSAAAVTGLVVSQLSLRSRRVGGAKARGSVSHLLGNSRAASLEAPRRSLPADVREPSERLADSGRGLDRAGGHVDRPGWIARGPHSHVRGSHVSRGYVGHDHAAVTGASCCKTVVRLAIQIPLGIDRSQLVSRRAYGATPEFGFEH
jgi:hypothetical protein